MNIPSDVQTTKMVHLSLKQTDCGEIWDLIQVYFGAETSD